ncbi:hypothetical protein O181_013084 [Austropuccinia psidii MF-1]|uniref:Uncharacterized protein n=1 Tax=Austropuccinia psidii MF-1 TaxID=1389203 RepID=A0A9Q3BVS0_9BASI|nr:hypothetical protein [Austropuccinia psidii MF-1]
MASSGHFDPTQIYDSYKAVEVLDPACTECLPREKIVLNITIPDLHNSTTALMGRSHAAILGSKLQMQTNVGGPIPVGCRPIYSSSEVPISRINTEGILKRIRQIADSPPDPDAKGSDELDGE